MPTYRVLEHNTILVKLTVGRTAGVTVTTVRVLIPVLGTRQVRLCTVCPEDRTDSFCSSVGGEGLGTSSVNYSEALIS